MTNLNEYQFGWTKRTVDEFGEDSSSKDRPLHVSWHHAEGPHGFGPETPSQRDYGAVVEQVQDSATRYRDVPHRRDPRFGYNYSQLRHVSEYGNIDNMVNYANNENAPPQLRELETHDLVGNLYSKRPNFPKRFATPDRAKYVAELLVKRRDANIPLTPRQRNR